jgi:hypothetical protein
LPKVSVCKLAIRVKRLPVVTCALCFEIKIQSLKDLKNKNVILNLRQGENMMNPLAILSSSDSKRSGCMAKYTKELVVKHEDPVLDFYPKYKDQ